MTEKKFPEWQIDALNSAMDHRPKGFWFYAVVIAFVYGLMFGVPYFLGLHWALCVAYCVLIWFVSFPLYQLEFSRGMFYAFELHKKAPWFGFDMGVASSDNGKGGESSKVADR